MMLIQQHHDVRTTLTLDDDVAAKLRAEARRSGRSFKETVNEALRRSLTAPRGRPPATAFRVVTRDLGGLREGLSLDNVADLVEQVEGPRHR
jgi:plasmid stability protein